MLLEMLKNSPPLNFKLGDYAGWLWPILILYRLIGIIVVFVWYLIKRFFQLIFYLIQKFRVAKIVAVILVVLCIVGALDFFVWNEKIYPGVYAGEIDLSGKTIEEATSQIYETYGPRLASNNVIIYSNSENETKGIEAMESVKINPELNLEDARKNIQYWQTNAEELQASIPAIDIAHNAYSSTRGLDKIFVRLGALLFKQKIDPWIDFNRDAITSLTAKINSILGHPMTNPTVTIDCAVASPVEGSDGNLIIEDEFTSQLTNAFLQIEASDAHFVPNLRDVYQEISFDCAKECSNRLNEALNVPVNFEYESKSWKMDPITFSQMIEIKINDDMEYAEQNSTGCSKSSVCSKYIIASVSNNSISSYLLSKYKDANEQDNFSLEIKKQDDNVVVNTNKEIEIPNFNMACEDINNNLLNNTKVYEYDIQKGKDSNNASRSSSNPLNISLSKTTVKNNISFNEALDLGLIREIAKYSTSYSSGAGSENRNHNISLVASKLDNSICKANGGVWSFNDIAGNCDEAAGFLPAGTIVGTRTIDEAGGGICQVATTVFNCVYNSGLPISERSPHNTYIESYPAGRDAAISWPSPDLVWKNDTESDVYLRVVSTGYSVEATLYGINYGYKVTSEVGDWQEGEDYKVEVVVDPSKKENSSYIQTKGSKGKSIKVTRKVYARDGKLLRQDVFESKYKPKTEIRVIGPGTEANQLLANNGARMKDSTDKW